MTPVVLCSARMIEVSCAFWTVLPDLSSSMTRSSSIPLSTSHSFMALASVTPLRGAPPVTINVVSGYVSAMSRALVRRRISSARSAPFSCSP